MFIMAVGKSRTSEWWNFWRSMLFHAFTHALVRLTIAVFWASIQSSNLSHAFGVHSITSSAAVEQVKLEELTFVQWGFVKDNRGGQHAVNRHRFKFVEALVFLLNEKKERKRKLQMIALYDRNITRYTSLRLLSGQ